MSSQILDHVEQIKSKVELMHLSVRSHALIVNGPAGFGKTQAVSDALSQLGVKAARLGSYSTPLHFFNHLHENFDRINILDDTAGLFYDRTAMATLKAAMWPSPDGRIVSWGSAKTLANVDEFEFRGKLIIICNSFPMTPDAIAIKSRSLTHEFQISKATAKELLLAAASDPKWFKNSKRAKEVAEFLCENLNDANFSEISYRTLHMAYDAAENMPGKWRQLVGSMIQAKEKTQNPEVVIRDLAMQKIKIGEQVRIFEQMTGFKRRTFFKYRKRLILAKGQAPSHYRRTRAEKATRSPTGKNV